MKNFLSVFFYAWLVLNTSSLVAQNWQYKSQAEIEKEELEKLKVIKKSIAFSLQYGHFELLPQALSKDVPDYVNIDDYHGQFNLVVEYYAYEQIAAQVSIGLIVIPKQQSIDSISFIPGTGLQGKGSGKGGAILPITFGVKKTFLKGLARPYVSLLSGFNYIKIGTGTGTGNINGVEKNIDYQSKFTFCYQLGSGIQCRTGKVVRFDFGVNFYGSPRFSSSIGGINSYQGFYVFGGMNFILNPRK